MGGRGERDLTNDDQADIAAIQTSLDHGVTHIDTAEVYANGYAEELVGRALKDRDRSELFLASKVFKNHFSYDEVISACRGSLKRLSTEYLDLYMLHRYSPDTPLKDLIRALETLKDEGLIRNIGVSNFGVEHLKEAQSYTKHPIVCNQVHYNLEFREPERGGLLEYCQSNDIMLVAFRPIQRGLFGSNTPELLEEMAKKYGKTPTQIALQWLLSQKNVVTISKTSRTEHLEENLGAIGWNMEAEDIERLRKEYPGQKDVSDSVPLG